MHKESSARLAVVELQESYHTRYTATPGTTGTTVSVIETTKQGAGYDASTTRSEQVKPSKPCGDADGTTGLRHIEKYQGIDYRRG